MEIQKYINSFKCKFKEGFICPANSNCMMYSSSFNRASMIDVRCKAPRDLKIKIYLSPFNFERAKITGMLKGLDKEINLEFIYCWDIKEKGGCEYGWFCVWGDQKDECYGSLGDGRNLNETWYQKLLNFFNCN